MESPIYKRERLRHRGRIVREFVRQFLSIFICVVVLLLLLLHLFARYLHSELLRFQTE